MTVNNDPVAQAIRDAYPYQVDLGDCDTEPLRHISVVQPFACLLVANIDERKVTHVSENSEDFLGRPWQELLDLPLRQILGSEVTSQIDLGLDRGGDSFDTLNPIQSFIEIGSVQYLANAIVHHNGEQLLIEIEKATDAQQTSAYQQTLARAVRRIQTLDDHDHLFSETALILRQLTGYHRTMVYQFDKDYNGEVIAESLDPNIDLEPFHGLRYPHTDIPSQARELYLTNRVRLINDVNAIPSRIRSADGADSEPIDLSLVGCRGCSPVHLEYLGYMGVNNTLSVAIVQDGKLWGLFAMHHYEPKTVDFGIRNLISFLGEIFSGHLSIQAATRYRELTLTRNLVRLGIGEQISKTRDVFRGLNEGEHNLMEIFPRLSSACIHFERRLERYGKDSPSEEDIVGLIEWIVEQLHADSDQLVYHNDSVGKQYKPFKQYCGDAAGVLVIFLSADYDNYICWFRPGMSRTVTWGGRPEKREIVYTDGTHRLGPRRSFERYVETVEGCSAPWSADEIDAAFALRITIINGLLQHYTEVKQINERLQKAYEDLETFSYTVSHDLRAPLRAINGYTEILEEEFGQQLDSSGKKLITGIQQGVEQMNNFISDILELSRVGSGGMQFSVVKVAPLVTQVVEELRPVYGGKQFETQISVDMPAVTADPRMLRQLFSNLVSNAFKYAEANEDRRKLLHIDSVVREVDGEQRTVYRVSNTGPTIPKEFRRSIFDMFSRLSTNTISTEGTGVGLAIVDRIVTRHGGRVWITDDLLGVTFNFYLAVNI